MDGPSTSQAPFTPTGLDALPPADVARKAAAVGVTKAGMSALDVFVLAVLAGAFIALGAAFATTVGSGAPTFPTASSGSSSGSRSPSA